MGSGSAQRGQKKGRFFVLLLYWRIVCGRIFIKFYYVVFDNEGYILTGVDCWFFFFQLLLLISTL